MQKLKQGVAVFMAIQTQSDTAMRNKIKLNTIVFRTTQKICVISEIRVPLIPPDRTGLRNLC